MRFYTAQPASRVSAIKCGKDVVPDWSKHPLADPNAKAYRYLLDTFNAHNATSALGLIFGYAFENLNALREAVRKAGMPSGAYFPGREMLVVNVPEEIPTLTVDFYRFSDLIFGFGDSITKRHSPETPWTSRSSMTSATASRPHPCRAGICRWARHTTTW